MTERPITIIGGGLAGLTLGIGLRQRGVAVTVWEAGTYPRHRVCGEFISGRGREILERLGMLDLILQSGARFAKDALFTLGDFATPVKPLPQPALCLSRYALDHALSQEFVRLGGDFRAGKRWREDFQEGVVAAFGRQPVQENRGPYYLGLKSHAVGVSLEADLEMHFVPEGYVGLCRLTEDRVNVCGLFQLVGKKPDLSAQWRDWLRGPDGSVLRTRLSSGEFDEDSFCATAGFSLKPKRGTEYSEIRIGDALTMIPPLTGNGMSMAFESAEIAIDPIARFSCGEIEWLEAKREIDERSDRLFARRLRWGKRLHPPLFHSIPRRSLMSLASHSDWLWKKLYSLTR
ncbi:MAG: FAD-dependent monooxygenase [Candidatus Omnitrophica bacterium]|nr:FAD-dependent monooxygenase [Candidatus Omnitrophota bacterium]